MHDVYLDSVGAASESSQGVSSAKLPCLEIGLA